MSALFPVLLLLQEDSSQAVNTAAGAGAAVFGIIYLALILITIAAMWKVFQKAGEPGWAAIIPIYNLVVLLKIAGKPVWWILLFLIPFVNFVMLFVLGIAVAERFGKGTGFGIGLALLPFIFYPLLAWGDARYSGPVPAMA